MGLMSLKQQDLISKFANMTGRDSDVFHNALDEIYEWSKNNRNITQEDIDELIRRLTEEKNKNKSIVSEKVEIESIFDSLLRVR